MVEEVPCALVCQCADATVEDVPPGVVEAVVGDILGVALGPEGHGARFVHGVVVEVAHHDDADLRVDLPEAVGDVLGQLGGGDAVWFALLLSAESRWPVVDDDGYSLTEELADDAHLVAGGEGHGG